MWEILKAVPCQWLISNGQLLTPLHPIAQRVVSKVCFHQPLWWSYRKEKFGCFIFSKCGYWEKQASSLFLKKIPGNCCWVDVRFSVKFTSHLGVLIESPCFRQGFKTALLQVVLHPAHVIFRQCWNLPKPLNLDVTKEYPSQVLWLAHVWVSVIS